jgi:hypothetical protein
MARVPVLTLEEMLIIQQTVVGFTLHSDAATQVKIANKYKAPGTPDLPLTRDPPQLQGHRMDMGRWFQFLLAFHRHHFDRASQRWNLTTTNEWAEAAMQDLM